MADECEKLLANLPDRRRRFVEEYIIDFNGTRAATQAGYTKRSAHVQSSRLLKDDKVVSAIECMSKKMSAESALTVEKVLKDIERVRGLAEDKERFGDAMKASELQGKYLKMWVDRVEHSVDESIADRILAARERAGE